MRAKEFIAEQRIALSQEVARAVPGTYAIAGLPNSDFYKQYRFGVAMSKAPDANINLTDQTNVADKLAILPYTEADLDIVKKAGKTMKAAPKFISTKGTKEENGGNITSPVAKFKSK